MKNLFLFCVTALLSLSVFANETSKMSVHDLVNEFYAKKETQFIQKLVKNSPTPKPMPPGCNPETSPSCEDVACLKLGTFGCDEIGEVQEVRRACRGNYNGNCLDQVCTKLGSFDCDEINEVKSVARACVGNYDMSCFQSTCNRLGTFGCDEISEVEEVLRTCSGY